jgi:hypothetical protein
VEPVVPVTWNVAFSFFAIDAFLAAIHSQSCFRCGLSVSQLLPPFQTLDIGYKKT